MSGVEALCGLSGYGRHRCPRGFGDAEHVGRQQSYLVFAKQVEVRGHVVHASVRDGRADVVDVGAVQPDRIGQVRGTEDLVAAPVLAVAGRAQRLKCGRPAAIWALIGPVALASLKRPLSVKT